MKILNQYLSQTKLWMGILVLASMFLIGCFGWGVHHQVDVAVSVNEPYTDYSIDELDSYGVWNSMPPYGRVWRPNVAREWTPFYYGHWTYAEPNWTWVSYEPFGWIVYHYGRWIYTPEYAWVWIPDNGEWSPANVEWMYYDDFVCWAPLPPDGILWPRPWERYEDRTDVWNVVHSKDFVSENVGDHRLGSSLVHPADEQHVQIVNHFPDSKMIEARVGRPIESVKIDRAPVQVGKQQLHKMQVPQSEQERVERNRPQAESHVTRRSAEHR